jgi:haloalkane dehalogenase
MNRPDWLDLKEYPFRENYLSLEQGQMQYVDEGQGETVVMVHGTPEWSFVYRKLIKGLRSDYRCIVPDFLGFGLSDKPAAYSYKPEEQAQCLEQFINMLDLKDITLVVHDFGGPIGLSYALKYPENIKRLIVMNTWMWSVKDDPFYALFSKLMQTPLGNLLYLHLNISPRVLMKQAMGDKSKLTPHIHQQYLKVFPTLESRKSLLTYARALVGSSAWYESLWQQRDKISDIPTLFFWGMKDAAFKEKELHRLESIFTHYQTIRLDNVGHFVQEEAGDEIVPKIKEFLKP